MQKWKQKLKFLKLLMISLFFIKILHILKVIGKNVFREESCPILTHCKLKQTRLHTLTLWLSLPD